MNHSAPTEASKQSQSKRLRRFFARLWRRNPGSFIGLVLLVLITLVGIFAPYLPLADPDYQILRSSLKQPGWVSPTGQRHLLGTDHLGRDMLARLFYGARTSLMVGISAVALAGILGVAIGLVAGYVGGITDSVAVAIIDTQLAVPFILLTVTVLGIFGHSLRNIIIVLGLTGWVPYARSLRAETMSLKRREFVEASNAMGCSHLRIMLRHILPNAMASVIVISTLMVARTILAEAALSFIGLGLEPPNVSWGGMLADGRAFLSDAWWSATFPGLAILVTVLSINLVGDWLRDVLDPRLRGV